MMRFKFNPWSMSSSHQFPLLVCTDSIPIFHSSSLLPSLVVFSIWNVYIRRRTRSKLIFEDMPSLVDSGSIKTTTTKNSNKQKNKKCKRMTRHTGKTKLHEDLSGLDLKKIRQRCEWWLECSGMFENFLLQYADRNSVKDVLICNINLENKNKQKTKKSKQKKTHLVGGSQLFQVMP